MKGKKKYQPWLFSFPALVLIGIIIVFPILYTGYISLTNMNLFHWLDYKVIGLENFRRALFKVDSGFLKALLVTLVWTAVNMVLQTVMAYFIALGLNAPGLKARRLYKTLLMFPWAMPSYVSILLWRVGMYNTEFGLINKFAGIIGLPKVNFLSENIPAFLSCMVLNLWMALPFMIMMFDGALQSIDKCYYESAKLDGAGFLQQNISITVPFIKPIMAPAVIMTTFTTFKQFDIFYLLTMQKGAYTGATIQTIITYAYKNAFVSNNYGLSSAVSIIIFAIIIVLSLVTNRGVGDEQVDGMARHGRAKYRRRGTAAEGRRTKGVRRNEDNHEKA
ncbi:carbohydrate ABC transporter permease [Anaerocolumna jejuensis]|uniref:carbohydrate ABC transporter permease n=1 Tax=Anaerocolumna jejuensis TaxID=259063 RepID=UPI003F7C5998